MAEYSTIKGWTIPTLSSDPPSPVEGQIWYNSTSNDIKCQSYVLGSGVWSSGGGMVNARLDCGAAGIQTSGLAIGGQTTPTDNYTEKYDGTSWTETGDLNAGRGYEACFGTQTAAVCGGGAPVNPSGDLTEEFNGTGWTVGNIAPIKTYAQMRCGTQTAGLQGSGGFYPEAPFYGTESITYDGTNWAETGDINTGRVYTAGGGIQTSAVLAGGDPPSYATTAVETYNGSTWSTSPASLNVGRGALSGSGTSATNCIVYGGNRPPPSTNATESFDGTSWTEVADLAAPSSESGFGPTGSNTSALCIGGAAGPGRSGVTEEWNVPSGPATKTFTDS